MENFSVELLLPSLSALSDAAAADSLTLEDVALAAAESGAREISDLYVGETAFLLLVVRAPHAAAHLLHAVSKLDEVDVSARPLSVDDAAAAPAPAAPTPAPAPIATAASSLPPPPAHASPALSAALQSPAARESPAVAAGGPPVAPLLDLGGAVVAEVEEGDRGTSSEIALPILRKSAWVSVPDPVRHDVAAGVGGMVDAQVVAGGRSGGGPVVVATVAPQHVVCKGLWVLVRPPPELADDENAAVIVGGQRIAVTMREQRVSSSVGRRSIGDAISLADRVSGPASAIHGSKVVEVHSPLELSCRHVAAGGNYSRTFVAITARNTTSDAVISIVPPYVHLAASTVVEVDGTDGTSARTSGRVRARTAERKNSFLSPRIVLQTPRLPRARTPRGASFNSATDGPVSIASLAGVTMPAGQVLVDDDGLTDPRVSLEDYFVFKREEGVLDRSVRDSEASEGHDAKGNSTGSSDDWSDNEYGMETNTARQQDVDADPNVQPLGSHLGDIDADADDFGMFIPSFGRRLRHAVSVGPREVFDFVFAVTPKVSDGASRNGGLVEGAPKLAAGQLFETSVSLAWACQPHGSGYLLRNILRADLPLQRELSSGGVLATGQRSGTAVRVLSVRWSPPSLVEDIIMSFSGPPVAHGKSRVVVSVTIVNQTRSPLNAATLFIRGYQKGGTSNTDWTQLHSTTDLGSRHSLGAKSEADSFYTDHPKQSRSRTRRSSFSVEEQPQLLPLRTVLAIGPVAPGSSVTARISCVALGRGCAMLGDVQVADMSPMAGTVPRIWRAHSCFKTFVVDPPPTPKASKPANPVLMVAEDLSLVEL